MGSRSGIPEEKLTALEDHERSPVFTRTEHLALRYAEAMTLSDRDVDDALFAELREAFGEEALVELTAVIAWENASSKFNRALRIESQNLWKGKPA